MLRRPLETTAVIGNWELAPVGVFLFDDNLICWDFGLFSNTVLHLLFARRSFFLSEEPE